MTEMTVTAEESRSGNRPQKKEIVAVFIQVITLPDERYEAYCNSAVT